MAGPARREQPSEPGYRTNYACMGRKRIPASRIRLHAVMGITCTCSCGGFVTSVTIRNTIWGAGIDSVQGTSSYHRALLSKIRGICTLLLTG